ncbi:Imm8 family immunity protein [Myxococcus sp. NMCA1]|uniref:Imm8 family immunity protein n=1 Tax=Myxococcus sp. NMCA1 TaxID=2996785 RepID=UPI002285BECE|nr:Imm8 family immunity protein [Myxococcus sp. NMCA1]WAM25153.1 Imm8 family immunity protein [Myxococcus sp. NMCA1]
MKPGIQSVGIANCPNIRDWVPDDPDAVVAFMFIEIGPRTRGKGALDQVKKSDTFTIMVATPAGLNTLEPKDGILLSSRKLVVMHRYDLDDLWRWLERTVASCEAAIWEECVDKLRAHFHWEFECMG